MYHVPHRYAISCLRNCAGGFWGDICMLQKFLFLLLCKKHNENVTIVSRRLLLGFITDECFVGGGLVGGGCLLGGDGLDDVGEAKGEADE